MKKIDTIRPYFITENALTKYQYTPLLRLIDLLDLFMYA